MKKTSKVIALLLLVSTLSLGACQKPKTETTSQSVSSQPSDSQSNPRALKPVADEWVETETTQLIPVVDPLGQHLKAARMSFEKKDYQKAANEMEQAAAFLDKEKEIASVESQAKIEEAVKVLNNTTQKLKEGQIKSWTELQPAFQQAYKTDIEHIWVTATEDQWVPIIEKPEFYWRSAYDSFVSDDYLDAANNIHKGVAFLDLRSHYFKGKDRETLLQSAKTLKELAERIKNGEITEAKILEKAFAKEHLMVAKADVNEAGKSLSEQKNTKTGYLLKAAAHNLELAGDWVDQKSLVQSPVQKSREIGEQLITSQEKSIQKADNLIKSLNNTSKELERYVS